MLDKMFTNCESYYQSPCIIESIGKSDHNCVLLSPGSCLKPPASAKYVLKQYFNSDVLDNLGTEISHIRWQDVYSMQSCNDMVEFFLYKHVSCNL